MRHQTTYRVSRERLEALRATMEDLSMNPPEEGDSLRFLGSQFVVGDPADVITEPHAGDLAAIAAVVRNAARQADYTIITHEGDNSRFVPAQFLVTFARAMIDEGADVFVGHGPHVLRAVEIYRGKPILYSLGDFLSQNETLQRLPHENYARFELGEDKGLADFNDARYENDTVGFPRRPRYGSPSSPGPCSKATRSWDSHSTRSLSGSEKHEPCAGGRCSRTRRWAARSSTT